jgi:2-dehydro-3-deoxyphosphogluconate aldolase / (4S)-4-hydroxy-2-oxoglutarate aldolase
MSKLQIIQRLTDPGIIAIIRANSSEQLVDTCEALVAGGINAIELTMTTPNAIEVTKTVTTKLGDKVLIGLGTVLDETTARLGILAGAKFIVTPVTRPAVVSLCNRYGIPIACGAYTPTEAITAQESGADFVKIFPADQLGTKYIKNILAPLPQLNIIPTGGVDVNTAPEFIKAGCAAVAAGSSLVSKEILKNRDWKKLTETAASFVKAVKSARA